MAALLAGAIWAGLVGWLLLRLLRQFRTHRNASLGPPPTSTEPLPPVAILVPARNEIGNIGSDRNKSSSISIKSSLARSVD